METTIPFSGFYHSEHDYALDYALEQEFQNSSNGSPNRSLLERAYSLMDWGTAHELYAKAYTEAFAEHFEITVTFKDLVSPREYNFTTDRIFCEIAIHEVRRIRTLTDEKQLRDAIRRRFTSRDGFISFYSNDIEEWPGDMAEWDPNHIGTLVEAYVATQIGDDDDCKHRIDIMDDTGETACRIIQASMRDCPETTRLYKIADYLREREERQYR